MNVDQKPFIKGLEYEIVPQFPNRSNLENKLKVIVNAQHKGGVGKTSDTILQAHYIANILKKRVLVIDLDKQANLSTTFIKMEKEEDYVSDVSANWMPPVHPDHGDDDWGSGRYSFVDLFEIDDTGTAIGLVPYETNHPRIDLIPAYSSRLGEFVHEDHLFRSLHSKDSDFSEKAVSYMCSEKYRDDFRHLVINTIVKAIDSVREHVDRDVENGEDPIYDYIIFDTSPNKDLFIEAVIRSADHIVLPYFPDAFTLEGMNAMKRMIGTQNAERAKEGRVPTTFTIQPNKIQAGYTNQIKDLEVFASLHEHQVNIPIKAFAGVVELWNYKPEKNSAFTHRFKKNSKEYMNIVAAMENIFG